MILITGATGFLGSHLLKTLLAQDEHVVVRALFRNQHGVKNVGQFFSYCEKSTHFNRIEWVCADILDIPTLTKAFTGITHVYHCAALVSFDPNDEENLRKTNIEGTANVVNLCIDFNIIKFLYVSSIAALGNLLPHEKVVTETSEWNPEQPHSDYAISKFGAEMEVWRSQQEGLDVLVINPGVILGTVTSDNDWKRGTASIFEQVSKTNLFYTTGTTGFVGVADVVSIMIKLMQSDNKNEKYIVVAENVNYQQFTNLVAKSLNQNSASIHAKQWMTALAWRADCLASYVFKRKRRVSKSLSQALHAADIYDNTKIKDALGFHFEPIEFVVAQIAASYLKQQQNL